MKGMRLASGPEVHCPSSPSVMEWLSWKGPFAFSLRALGRNEHSDLTPTGVIRGHRASNDVTPLPAKIKRFETISVNRRNKVTRRLPGGGQIARPQDS
jgi:hypothetical protein